LRELVRVEVVISVLHLELNLYLKEIDKLQNQKRLSDPKQLDAYLKQVHETAEKAIKNLTPQDEFLD
jgi:hypothetical protein